MRFRLTSVVHHLDRVGWQAVPIILLITFLIGGIISQQGFFHFQKFGADEYVVDMVTADRAAQESREARETDLDKARHYLRVALHFLAVLPPQLVAMRENVAAISSPCLRSCTTTDPRTDAA